MQRQKKRKAIGALVLVMALCLGGMIPALSTYAGNTVDVDKKCTLTVEAPTPADYPELQGKKINVKLYRVADMKPDGSVERLKSGAFAAVDVSTYGSEATADDLKELAEALRKAAESESIGTVSGTPGDGQVRPDKEMIMENGAVTFGAGNDGLTTGLYLVLADAVFCKAYEYRFQPILITLPTTEEIKDTHDGKVLHNLVYDGTAALKAEKADLLTRLTITKRLKDYGQYRGYHLPEAGFIFEVNAVKEGKTVYSNVVSLKYGVNGWENGTASKVLEGIPAGADVTVKEVYSGASYAESAAPEVTKTAWSYSEDGTAAGSEEEKVPVPAGRVPEIKNIGTYPEFSYEVVFTNKYSGKQSKGVSIVNEYEYNEDSKTWSYKGNGEGAGE